MTTRPTIGFELWSTQRGWRGVDDAGQQTAPYGGVCVAVSSILDEETGELVDAYTVVDGHHGHLTRHVLTALEVDPDCRPASDHAVASLVYRLARAVGGRRQRTGLCQLHKADILDAHDLLTLVDLLVERHGPAHYGLDTPQPAKTCPPREPVGPPNVQALVE